ncbi:FtsX-like permease family protein [Clostridium cavendishii DSM 21758]|uniref:FtsX-like permease family protein n=1 Tax=Clostridium cavendishii DSM 21758 TaxID=1121302 RepID=A0A1M6FF92_9CLOT|nr:ABC transporter permease [Clostridium cavendishii]SHI96371.1 FtsX-like permease family protein [Clostridium cavendishii DSM 21758]
MTFSSIIRKNFIHNFNKYISFYFVNSLIVAMLFMYGSLAFNRIILENSYKTSLDKVVNTSLMGLIIFSIIFITYTNVAFLKNRGKEFGMYMTLGMTTKDLSRLIIVENLGIMLSAAGTGILFGVLFGRLFYMGLNKILKITPVPYELNYKSFLLSLGVFILIFLANVIFNMIYIRRVSIINVIKSSKKKEIGKSNIILGIVALILLVVSIYCVPKTLLKEIFKDQQYIIWVFISLTIICPYILIGSLISIVKNILSKFPRTYNKNILVLSNLSHRFLAYKNVLYMLSLLVAGAMFFVGFSYSLYTATREYVEKDRPYDIFFVETNEYNKVKKDDVEEVIKKNNGVVKDYKVLEQLAVPSFIIEDSKLSLNSGKDSVISETNYNKHMGTNIDIKPNEAMYITVVNEKMEFEQPTVILATINKTDLEKVKNNPKVKNNKISKEEFQNIIGQTTSLYLDKKNIEVKKGVPFTNFAYNSQYLSLNALVLDDEDYNKLKNNLPASSVEKTHLLNVKNGDDSFKGLVNYLRDDNGLDYSYWREGTISNETLKGERGIKECYRPVYNEELIRLQLNRNGLIFFTMIFIGALFVISNGVVLYYKVLSDIDSEMERIESLNRIGVKEKELKSTISKELGITFFIPMLVGGGLGTYYLYVLSSNTGIVELLMQKAFLVLGLGVIVQFIFYLISREKYIKEVI